jgi:hypothetical protein
MPLRFEDHKGFERTCLMAAAGGALAAYYATWMMPAARLVPWAAAGALFAVGVALCREHELPPPACIAAAVALGVGVCFAAPSVPVLSELLETVLPRAGAAALGGAVLGLWSGAATVPLHLRTARDRVEQRLAGLRPRLAPELFRLAERAAAARAELLRSAPSEVRPGLRRAADGLALAALDLAEQGTDVSRARLVEQVARLERARDAF